MDYVGDEERALEKRARFESLSDKAAIGQIRSHRRDLQFPRKLTFKSGGACCLTGMKYMQNMFLSAKGLASRTPLAGQIPPLLATSKSPHPEKCYLGANASAHWVVPETYADTGYRYRLCC